jgi:hypothetical protein
MTSTVVNSSPVISASRAGACLRRARIERSARPPTRSRASRASTNWRTSQASTRWTFGSACSMTHGLPLSSRPPPGGPAGGSPGVRSAVQPCGPRAGFGAARASPSAWSRVAGWRPVPRCVPTGLVSSELPWRTPRRSACYLLSGGRSVPGPEVISGRDHGCGLGPVEIKHPDPCRLHTLVDHSGDPLQQLITKFRILLALVP